MVHAYFRGGQVLIGRHLGRSTHGSRAAAGSPYSGGAFAWVMVMVVELVNSAIEAALNRFGTEIHPLTKRGKDIASAAVFCAVSFNVILWALLAYRLYWA